MKGRLIMSNENTKTRSLPLLPLRGLTVFPYMVLHIDVGRKKSILALEEAMVNNQEIFLTSQNEPELEEPYADSLFKVGTISKVKQLLKLPGDTIRVLIEGVSRGKIVEFIDNDEFFQVIVEEGSEIEEGDPLKKEALMRSVMDAFETYTKLSNKISPDTLVSINTVEDVGQFADIIAANVLVNNSDKQEILEAFNPEDRLEKLFGILKNEIKILRIEKKINLRVKKQIDKVQRDYYLREQMKAIQDELGERDSISTDVEKYNERIQEANLPEVVQEKAIKELDRFSRTSLSSPESSMIRSYLDWILDLPWNYETKDNHNLKTAARILDQDHYGLENVKERVIEYLAVLQLTQNMKGPILCFVGPPGVGKTSIAKSIARALGRNFVRMSLGGVRDEAEIKGHRRTYIGSIPGTIISSIKQGGSKNPVFLLDEIDKMSGDFRGDPASALLEVLDPEQNSSFRDHYLELPFDLSKVMFLTTANTLETIPRPLLDRMEVIRIAGYTEDEKTNIATKYLIPKQLEAHGLEKGSISIFKQTTRNIINYYTREAGVRNLERQIAAICRKGARKLLETEKKRLRITPKSLHEYLGIPKFSYNKINQKDEIGLVTGLAWTAVGGDTLYIEVTPMLGTGKLVLTGQLGDVMKESASAGLSYIRSKTEEFGIDPEFYKNRDLHIHVPEGAIPKDGPSAGITIATAVISALTRTPVRRDIAMTGEITLRGRVLPIGGLKEKMLAAHRAGITKVIIPAENLKDLEEIPQNIKSEIEIVSVEKMEDVLKHALVKGWEYGDKKG